MASSETLLEDLRKSRLKSYQATPGDIEEHRRAELRVAGDTAGRPLIELIQNADDAMNQFPDSEDNRAKIILQNNKLLVANTGAPFSDVGVEAICNLDRSPKKDRRITIGNKGIGFKSVLTWTKKPSIHSTTYAFTYDREKSAREISQALNEEYQTKHVPLMRLPFSPNSRDELTNQLLQDGYATVIILPIKNGTVSKYIFEELENFDPLTLLFLNSVSHLSIVTDDFERQYRVFRKEVQIIIKVNGEPETYKIYKDEKEIPNEILPSLPEDCRDLTHSTISIAIPETPLEIYYQLFSHFPTSEKCPFKFFMHGDFILDAGRKHLRGDAKAYNQWVVKEIASLFINEVMPSFGSNNPTVIDFLESRSQKDMESVERQIFDAFVEKIVKIDFLPALKNSSKLVSPQSSCVSKRDTIDDIINIFESEIEWENRFLIDQAWSTDTRIETLKKFGCKEIKKPDFVKLIGALARPNPIWCTELLNIILRWIATSQSWRSREIANSLKDQKLFLTTKLKLRSLSSGTSPPLFLPPAEAKRIEIPSFIPLDFLNHELGKNIEKAELKLAFKNRLQGLSKYGLHLFKPREIVEKAVLPVIKNTESSDQYGPDYQEELLIFLAQLEPSENKFENIDPYPWFNELRTRLANKVCVPTEGSDWIPAWKVYASKEWGASEQLMQVYEGATDRYLLASPDQTVHKRIPVDKWKNLYRYLGVSWEPKILGIENQPSYISQYSFSNLHPSWVSEQDWELYGSYFRNAESLSDMWRWTIQLKESYVLDNWYNLRNDTEKSINLLHLLYLTDIFNYVADQQKEKIRCRFRYTKISNSYWASCDSFLLWGINNLDWVPSKSGRLLPPKKVFLIDSEVGKGLKGIVPVLQIERPQDKVLNRRFEDLIEEIGIRTKWTEITVEDWNSWLRDLSEIGDNITKEHVRLAQTLYRHCLEQCKVPEDKEPFLNVNVLSLSAGAKYEFKLAKDVIYLNEPRYDSIKRILMDSEYSLFPVELGGEKRAKKAKDLFGLTLVSEIIDEDVFPGEELIQKSEEWQNRFRKISPVLLARLSKDRPESRAKDQDFLRSVKIVVVANLNKTFKLLEKETILFEEEPHTCWSNSDNTLYLNASSTERNLWSGLAESLSQRLNQTYYEAFENLILCQSDLERIEKLRKAGVPEDEVLYCENVLKEEPSHTIIDLTEIKNENAKKEKLDKVESVEEATEETKEGPTESEFLDPEAGDFGEEIEIEPKDGKEEIVQDPKVDDSYKDDRKPPGDRKPPKDKEVDQRIKEKTELAAMRWAERYEVERGWEPTDVSQYNYGYDIESTDPLTGMKRFIEVKGAMGRPDKREVTINEWRKAMELGDDYYIYYALGIASDEGEIRIIRNPAKKITPEEKAFDVNLSRESVDKYISLKKKGKQFG